MRATPQFSGSARVPTAVFTVRDAQALTQLDEPELRREWEKTYERYYELQKWLQRLRSEGQGAATPALGASQLSQLQDGSASPVGKVGPSVCLRLTRVVATARGCSTYACGAGACGEARAGVRPSCESRARVSKAGRALCRA